MKRIAVVILLLGAGISGARASADAPQGPPAAAAPPARLAASHAPAALSAKSQNELVARYCATCHSDRGKAGDLSLARFDAARLDQNGDVAEKMIRKLRA